MDAVLIDALPGDVRVAVLDNGRVTDLLVERASSSSLSGSVYWGRVSALAPHIDAAFVDIGQERAGFLGAADAGPGGLPTEGTALLVQVLAEPVTDAGGDKGAKLTAKPTLPGRLLVLTPGDGAVRLSKRIADPARRTALAGLLAPLKPDPDTGFVVRTEAAQADTAAVAAEAAALAARWRAVVGAAKAAKPPARLLRDDVVSQALRLAPAGARVLVAGPDAAERVACLGGGAQIWTGPGDLFAAHGADAAWDTALARDVALPGGGGLVIEETAALTAIDVNVGARAAPGRNGGERSGGGREGTALAVNLAAAAEIAAQVRLRNLGGLFVIDFARLAKPANRAKVLAALRAAGAGDPEGLNVAGETTFGLVEMTRPRRRPALASVLAAPCSACAGAGRRPTAVGAAFDALRRLLAESRARPGVAFALSAASGVARAFDGDAKAAKAAVEARLGRPVDIVVDAAMLEGAIDVTEKAT